MGNQLQSIKHQLRSTSPDSMSKTDFDQVSHTIEKLEAFQKIIQKGIQDRIYKIKGQEGSRIKGIEMIWIDENASFDEGGKIASPSSEIGSPRELGSDLVEQISDRFWDAQVDGLSGILHGLPLHRDNVQKIIKEGNELSLELQNLIFQQVGYIYKQKIISGDAFKKFCQSKITLEIAAFNMMYTCLKICGHYSPVTALNEWPSENYRNIYEGKYEESILINTNYSLNVPDI